VPGPGTRTLDIKAVALTLTFGVAMTFDGVDVGVGVTALDAADELDVPLALVAVAVNV